MQAKRIQTNHQDLGVAGQLDVELTAPVSPREEINYHNIWASFNTEPENADANAQGSYVLYVRKEGVGATTWSNTKINDEEQNPQIIACGAWGSSNQTPETITIHPSTSRTLQAGDKLVLSVHIHGITAGVCSIQAVICAHVTRK